MKMKIIDKRFLKEPKNYIFQTLLAIAVMTILIHLIGLWFRPVIVASLGASTFIVFAMPHSVAARTRRLVGGHITGLICGTLFYFVFFVGPLQELTANQEIFRSLASALAIGASMFLMAITDTEHPPAAATALDVVISGWSYPMVLFVLLSAVSLAIVRRLLLSRLKDLV